jgi:hypothetical protein
VNKQNAGVGTDGVCEGDYGLYLVVGAMMQLRAKTSRESAGRVGVTRKTCLCLEVSMLRERWRDDEKSSQPLSTRWRDVRALRRDYFWEDCVVRGRKRRRMGGGRNAYD